MATIENVNDLVASFKDLFLNGAEHFNMLITKKYAKINVQKQVNTKTGLMQTAMIKEMHSIEQEGDIRIIKVSKT